MVLPHGNMIAKQLEDGSYFSIFLKDCTGFANIVKHQRVPLNKKGNWFISNSYSSSFTPPGWKTQLGFIIANSRRSSHEIKNLCTDLAQLKQHMANAVVKEESGRNGV